MRGPRSACILAIGVALLACDPTPEHSDADQYELDVALDDPLVSDGRLVLVGSSFDVGVDRIIPSDSSATNCIEMAASGVVAQADARRFEVTAAGPGAIEFLPPSETCSDRPDYAGLEADRFALTGVDAAVVGGRWASAIDGAIINEDLSPGPRGVFPDVLGAPLDTLPVVAGAPFEAVPALVRTDVAGAPAVRWGDDEELVVPGHFEALLEPIEHEEDGLADFLRGTLAAGESLTPSLELLGVRVPLPEVRAVPVESLRSLEVIPVYAPGDETREWGPPLGVLAITRDIEGQRVLGAPVEFELTRGTLGLFTERDALYLDDTCRPAPRRASARSATIHASVGDLEADVDLEWIALPSDEAKLIDDDSYCEGPACTCSSTHARGESVPALLALFGLGAWLRRRPD